MSAGVHFSLLRCLPAASEPRENRTFKNLYGIGYNEKIPSLSLSLSFGYSLTLFFLLCCGINIFYNTVMFIWVIKKVNESLFVSTAAAAALDVVVKMCFLIVINDFGIKTEYCRLKVKRRKNSGVLSLAWRFYNFLAN